jgi:dTDP-glucose 4,6-dehydratase
MKTMLITGANGFIGHYLIKEFAKDYNVICMVRPESNLDRLGYVEAVPKIIYHDITKPINPHDFEDIHVILHAAGNPSSASSFQNPTSVVYQNVLGTVHLLELAKEKKVERFVYYGAGESYGSLKNTSETINMQYDCNSPYAASKSAGEEFCCAYSRTHKIPVSIIHITNTFGERCQNNRFSVVALRNILRDEKINIASVDGVPSGRHWFHADDVALHTRFVLNFQKNIFEKWNSAGVNYINNVDFVGMIAKTINKDFRYELINVGKDSHSGKVFQHTLDPSKFYSQGYIDVFNLEDRILQMTDWYMENLSWL